MVGYHVPPAPHPDSAAVGLLVRVLGDAPGRPPAQAPGRDAAGGEHVGIRTVRWRSRRRCSSAPSSHRGRTSTRRAPSCSPRVDSLRGEPVTARSSSARGSQWLNDWDRGFTDPERSASRCPNAIAQGDWRLYLPGARRVRERHARPTCIASRPSGCCRDNRTIGLYLPTDKPCARRRRRASTSRRWSRTTRATPAPPGRGVRRHAGQPRRAHADARSLRQRHARRSARPKARAAAMVQARLRCTTATSRP